MIYSCRTRIDLVRSCEWRSSRDSVRDITARKSARLVHSFVCGARNKPSSREIGREERNDESWEVRRSGKTCPIFRRGRLRLQKNRPAFDPTGLNFWPSAVRATFRTFADLSFWPCRRRYRTLTSQGTAIIEGWFVEAFPFGSSTKPNGDVKMHFWFRLFRSLRYSCYILNYSKKN